MQVTGMCVGCAHVCVDCVCVCMHVWVMCRLCVVLAESMQNEMSVEFGDCELDDGDRL